MYLHTADTLSRAPIKTVKYVYKDDKDVVRFVETLVEQHRKMIPFAHQVHLEWMTSKTCNKRKFEEVLVRERQAFSGWRPTIAW